jgi:hypothetical protein
MTRARIAFALALVGLAVVGRGVADADPPLFGYTAKEYADADSGRVLMVVGSAVLVAAAAAIAAGGARVRPLLVLAPLLCTALALALPPYRNGWSLTLFVPLGLAALVAAVPRRRT